MKQLRDSTKIIMIVVAISFVGLMVFEWGMDFSGRSSVGSAASALGSVNGADISLEDYQRQYQILYQQAQQRTPDGGLTAEQLNEIEDQAWEDVIDLTLLRREAQNRDITITDAELIEFIKFNPPRDLVDLPAFQTDGRFDLEKYQQALADPTLSATWAQYEAQLRETLPVQKLQEQVVSSAIVTEDELLSEYRDRNDRARIEYVHLNPDVLVEDDAIAISEAEIQSYYDEHREDYLRDASATIRYVVITPEVTAADSAAVEAKADSLALVAAEPTADFAALARSQSDDSETSEDGGQLGWFPPSSMAPAFANAIEQLAVGEVSGPVQTDFGWHIVRLDEVQPEDQAQGEEPLVRASHILLEIEPSSESRSAARESAQSFAQAASTEAGAFESEAQARDLSVVAPPTFEQGPVIPGLGPVIGISEFAFSNEAGSVSGAIGSGDRFFVVHVDERFPEGYVALEQVDEAIHANLLREKKLAATRAMAGDFGEAVREAGLEEAASRFNLEIVSTDFFTRTNNIPGVGSGTPVAGAAFGLSQGQSAGPIEADRGVYYIRLLEKEGYDAEAFEREKDVLRGQFRRTKAIQVFNAWFEDLRESAEIEDRRAQLLGT